MVPLVHDAFFSARPGGLRPPCLLLYLGVPLCSADSQVIGESERSREQILQTLNDLSRGFQDIADRCLLVLHLEVR